MAREFNALDPLGIIDQVKKQADKMASEAGIQQLPALPKIKLPDPLGILGQGNPDNRPGYGRDRRV